MNREDLFLAIGQVEEDRLARSENGICPSDANKWEDNEMDTYVKYKGKRKVVRNLLIAAVVVTMLATTALAYGGFVLYENPGQMLEAFFGDRPEPHGEGCLCAECTATEPTYERGTLDEKTAMEEVAPYISAVGATAVDERMKCRLTVEAYAYDQNTGCGLVYYTLEAYGHMAEYPIQYQLESDGEIWGISPSTNHPDKHYLIAEESTATSLKIACYFIRADNGDDCFKIGFTGLIREDVDEKVEDHIVLPLEGGEMKCLSLADGKIVLSPIGMVIGGELPCVQREGSTEPRVDRLVIRYQDGTEYLIKNEDESNVTYNYAYDLMELQGDVRITYALNRVIDIDKVAAVIINGTEFPVE